MGRRCRFRPDHFALRLTCSVAAEGQEHDGVVQALHFIGLRLRWQACRGPLRRTAGSQFEA